ncbi:hypothetical protein QL285_092509 [Trifolium repens]|nr:hypothetical protein QL285_092509 [Trifolium repens]
MRSNILRTNDIDWPHDILNMFSMHVSDHLLQNYLAIIFNFFSCVLDGLPLGYVWIDGIEHSGMKRNKMKWSRTEWNGNIQFHCLGILLLSFIPLDTPQIGGEGK